MNATMTTTKTTTTCILAIDLGKYKSVACNYDPATSEAHFTTVATTRDELERLLSRVQTAVVVIKGTGGKLDGGGKQDESVQILESIPGVGPRTAETVTAYLGEPKRFTTGKQVSAYGGLVPRQFQSGELDRRGRITRRGPAL